MAISSRSAAPLGVAWLLETIKRLKGDDPLAPVTVVLPRLGQQQAMRRCLADHGTVNVRCVTVRQLAEGCAQLRLMADGARRLGLAGEAAVWRQVLAEAGRAGSGGSLALAGRLSNWRARNSGAIWATGLLADLDHRFDERLTTLGCYDHTLLLRIATGVVVQEGPPPSVGEIVVYEPLDLAPAETALLEALGGHVSVIWAISGGGPEDAAEFLPNRRRQQQLAVPDAPRPAIQRVPGLGDEVRLAVRQVIQALELGVPPHRLALAYTDEHSYAQPLRDCCARAGIPVADQTGERLTTSYSARALLAVLRMRSERFARESVVAWAGSAPWHGAIPEAAVWDRVSATGRIVAGPAQWRQRLDWLAAQSSRDSGASSDDGPAITRMAAVIDELDRALQPPADHRWQPMTAWLLRLHRGFASNPEWPADQVAASDSVADVIRSLADTEVIEAEVDAATAQEVLVEALRQTRLPLERGGGVVLGGLADVAGQPLDTVWLLGMTERLLPGRPAHPPLGQDEPAGAPAAHTVAARLLEALSAGAGQVILSAPLHDAEGSVLQPSRWLPGGGDGDVAVPVVEYRSSLEITRADLPPLTLAERRVAAAQSSGVGLALVAARPELPVGAAIRMLRARSSAELTEYDGQVPSGDLDRLSASALQQWASCPFAFFLRRQLRLPDGKDPEDEDPYLLESTDQGTLVHAILQQYYERWTEQGTDRPPDPELLQLLIRRHLEEWQGRRPDRHRGVWQAFEQRVRADLEMLLARDREVSARGNWRPVLFEQAFGDGAEGSWPAVEVHGGAAGGVTLSGFIDRIDVRGDPEHPAAVLVTDYKTGRADVSDADLAADVTVAGTHLQLALYGRAARARWPQADRAGRYWFIGRGNFATAQVALGDASDTRLDDVVERIAGGVAAGSFPAVPGAQASRPGRDTFENCSYCAFDRVCAADRDQAAERKREAPGHRRHAGLAAGGSDAGE